MQFSNLFPSLQTHERRNETASSTTTTPPISLPQTLIEQQVPACGVLGSTGKVGQEQGWAGQGSSPLVLQALIVF